MALFFTYALPLLLPTVIYLLWRMIAGRPAPSDAANQDGGATAASRDDLWRDAPWMWLALAGAALLALVLLVGVFVHSAPPSGQYVPPRMEGGKILPGELRDTETRPPSQGR